LRPPRGFAGAGTARVATMVGTIVGIGGVVGAAGVTTFGKPTGGLGRTGGAMAAWAEPGFVSGFTYASAAALIATTARATSAKNESVDAVLVEEVAPVRTMRRVLKSPTAGNDDRGACGGA
jgi:hypothetical protein